MGRLLALDEKIKVADAERSRQEAAHLARMTKLAEQLAAEIEADFKVMGFSDEVRFYSNRIDIGSDPKLFNIIINDDDHYTIERPIVERAGPLNLKHSRAVNCSEAEMFEMLLTWIKGK